jgi:hypothetical protein
MPIAEAFGANAKRVLDLSPKAIYLLLHRAADRFKWTSALRVYSRRRLPFRFRPEINAAALRPSRPFSANG